MDQEIAGTPASQEPDSSSFSIDDAAAAYLSRSESTAPKQDAPPTATEAAPAEPEHAPDTAQADEADVQDAASEPEAVEEYEVDLGGHKLRLSKDKLKDQLPILQAKAKELESGSQRRFQEAAEARKKADEYAAFVTQNSQLMGELQTVSGELQRIQGMDLEALSDSDPVAAQKAITRLMQLQQRQAQLVGAAQQAKAQMDATRAQLREQSVQEVRSYAQQNIKGWTPDLDKAMGDYVAKARVKQESVESLITDPAMYELAVKAYKYDTLQAAKPAVEKKLAEAPKTLKPNSANQSTSSAEAKVRDAMGRFQKNPSMDNAVEAYLARTFSRNR